MNTSDSPAFDTRPPRKQGRYDDPKQIEKKIDQALNEAAELQKQADALDAKADEVRKTGKGVGFILGWRTDATKLREQARRKVEVRCKFLKEKLGAIRTENLPFAESELRDGSLPKVGSDKFLDRTQK